MSEPRKSFKTEKGTELPLLNLKGKEYLAVAHRVVWFRERYADGLIKTQMLEHNVDKDGIWYAVFKTEVFTPDANGNLMLKSTAHQLENKTGFPDYLAKAETSSIGRALALAGIGTNFAFSDLDEATKLSDAPLDPPTIRTGSGTFSNDDKGVTTSGTVVTKEDVLAAKSATEAIENLPPVSPEPEQDAAPVDTPSFQTKRRQRENLKTKRDF